VIRFAIPGEAVRQISIAVAQPLLGERENPPERGFPMGRVRGQPGQVHDPFLDG
jgi:hypothetical protein